MRGHALIALSLLVIAVSCVEKTPSWLISWESDSSVSEAPFTPPPGPDTPDIPSDTDTPDRPIPSDVPLLESISQDFGSSDTSPFTPELRNEGDDFRYFPGFPSLSETGTGILMLRLDPGDSAFEGPSIKASGHTFYGSYSFRIKTPDLSRLKKTTDAVVEISLRGDDPEAGCSVIGMEWALSKPSRMTMFSLTGNEDQQSDNPVEVILSKEQDPSLKFQTMGWDWTSDYVRWWIIDSSTKEKKVIGEITDNEELPWLPALLSLRISHSADAPEYPFEIEIDNISYEPFTDYIQAWRERYFE